MRKIKESEKEYAMYSVRIKSSVCKTVNNNVDLQSIKSYYIEGICAGLISAGIYYENSFVKELYDVWENEPPYKK